MDCREFPGSPVVKTRCFHCQDLGSISGWRTKIPQATQHSQKRKKKKVNSRLLPGMMS